MTLPVARSPHAWTAPGRDRWGQLPGSRGDAPAARGFGRGRGPRLG